MLYFFAIDLLQLAFENKFKNGKSYIVHIFILKQQAITFATFQFDFRKKIIEYLFKKKKKKLNNFSLG